MQTGTKPKRKERRLGERRKAVPVSTVLMLAVRAGGRCEFYGCNEYLLRDVLTLSDFNHWHVAHIVASSFGGPRGDDPMPLAERNRIENLMLACRKHHALIDNPAYVPEYPKERLLAFKKEHEDRILLLTAAQPQSKTTVIRLQAMTGTQAVSIPFEDVRKAILPRYPADTTGLEIDLRQLAARDTAAYWETMAREITDRVRELHARVAPPPDHISVFALGPIPLLVHFGHELSNKILADVYQRHRAPEDWCWKNAMAAPVQYATKKLRSGRDKIRVGVLLSLSGTIPERDVPAEILEECTVYELTLDGIVPNPTFLNSADDLDRFRGAYQELIGLIKLETPDVSEIHLFPAVPAPVAVLVGRELLPKVHPALYVYDCNKANGHFQFALKVN